MITESRGIKLLRFLGLFFSTLASIFLWQNIQAYTAIITPLSENISQVEDLNSWHRLVLLLFMIAVVIAYSIISSSSRNQDIWESVNTLCPLWLRTILYGISILAWLDGIYCQLILFSIPAQNSYEIWSYWRIRSVLDGQIFMYSILVLFFFTLFAYKKKIE